MYYYCGKHHILLDCVLIDNSDKKDAIQVAKEYGVRNMATYASDHPFIYYVANNVSINDAVMETGEYIIEDDRGGNPNLIQCVWVLELDNYVSGGRL